MPDYVKGYEITHQAMLYLIDMDSGSFERLLMACRELFNLHSDNLSEDAVSIYLEIDSMFDKSKTHETEGFCWQNLMEMPEGQKQQLAEKILVLYSLLCRASEVQRISMGK